MQPGVNFRVTDKNVEQLVVVKDAAPPAILPFGKLSANDRYLRILAIASRSLNVRIPPGSAAIRAETHIRLWDTGECCSLTVMGAIQP